MGLEAGIWASRLGFEGVGTEEEKEEKEKIHHMCESIGHRPLQGRCPASPSISNTTYVGRARVPPCSMEFQQRDSVTSKCGSESPPLNLNR